MASPRRTAADIARELASRSPKPENLTPASKPTSPFAAQAADDDILVLDEDTVAETMAAAERDVGDPRSAKERRDRHQRLMYEQNLPRTAPTQPTSIRASKAVLDKRNAVTANALRKILYVVGPISLRAPGFAPVFGTQAYPYFKLLGFVNPEASVVLLKTAQQMYANEYKNETLTDSQRDSVLRAVGMSTHISVADVLAKPQLCEELAVFCSSSLETQEKIARQIFGSMEDHDPNEGFARLNPSGNKALAIKALQTVKASDRKIPKTPPGMGTDFSEFFSWETGSLVVGLPEADCFVSGITLARFMKTRGFEQDAKAIADAHRQNTPVIQFTSESADLREMVASSLGALAEFAAYTEQEKGIKSNHVVSVNTQRNRLSMFRGDTNPLLSRAEYAPFKKALIPAGVDYADLATPQGVFVLFNLVGPDAYTKQRDLLQHAVEVPELRRLLALSALGPYNLGIQRAWCYLVMSNIPLMTKLSQI